MCAPKVWHNFSFNLSFVAVVPSEIEDNAYANLEGKQGALWEFCKRIEAEKKSKITRLRHSLVPRAFPLHPFAKGKTLVTNEVDTDLPLHNSILLSNLWHSAFFCSVFAAFFVIDEHTFSNAGLISKYNYRHYNHVMKIIEKICYNFLARLQSSLKKKRKILPEEVCSENKCRRANLLAHKKGKRLSLSGIFR